MLHHDRTRIPEVAQQASPAFRSSNRRLLISIPRCRSIPCLANDRYTFLLNRWSVANVRPLYSSACGTRTAHRGARQRRTHITPLRPNKQTVADPLDYIAAFRAQFKVATVPGLPRFRRGLTGYFGLKRRTVSHGSACSHRSIPSRITLACPTSCCC